jgi:Zn ribbon nucleic-acid-binding protein
MKTQLDFSKLLVTQECPNCKSPLSMVQWGDQVWAVECMDECGFEVNADTMQAAFDNYKEGI